MRFFVLALVFSTTLIAETHIHGFLGQALPFSDFGFGVGLRENPSFRHRLNFTSGSEEFFGTDEGRYYLAEFDALSTFYSLDAFMLKLPFVITTFAGAGFWKMRHGIYEDSEEAFRDLPPIFAAHSGIKFSQEWGIFERWRISWSLIGACLTRILVKPSKVQPLVNRLERASIFGFLNLQLVYVL